MFQIYKTNPWKNFVDQDFDLCSPPTCPWAKMLPSWPANVQGQDAASQRTSSSSVTRTNSGCSVKCLTIQVCTSSTSVMVYTNPWGEQINTGWSGGWGWGGGQKNSSGRGKKLSRNDGISVSFGADGSEPVLSGATSGEQRSFLKWPKITDRQHRG